MNEEREVSFRLTNERQLSAINERIGAFRSVPQKDVQQQMLGLAIAKQCTDQAAIRGRSTVRRFYGDHNRR
jgi:hypothetical protein